jgi:predicted AAA+ superfamily ATPase
MYKRAIVSKIVERLNEPRGFIQILIGPRQTGKTTAIDQAKLKLKTPYHLVSADKPGLSSSEWLIAEWEKARELTRGKTSSAILIIDEIQSITQWSSYAKMLWDEDTRNRTPLKVLLTGSSSLLLAKGLNESLMGRFEVLRSPHWSLSECQEAFDYDLEEFLYFGGFPGSAHFRTDLERWRDYMGFSIIEPTISRDVMQLEDIRRPALLKALFSLGSAYSAQEVSLSKIAGQLQEKGNVETLSHYLDLLSNAGMLTGLQKYSAELLRIRKSSPRFAVLDTSLMIYEASLTPKQLVADKETRGHVVESAVGAYLLARSKQEHFKVFWWRDRGTEVDFVISKGQKLTAIEVKSGRIKNTGGVYEFMRRYPGAHAYVIGDSTTSLEAFLLGEYPLFK